MAFENQGATQEGEIIVSIRGLVFFKWFVHVLIKSKDADNFSDGDSTISQVSSGCLVILQLPLKFTPTSHLPTLLLLFGQGFFSLRLRMVELIIP